MSLRDKIFGVASHTTEVVNKDTGALKQTYKPATNIFDQIGLRLKYGHVEKQEFLNRMLVFLEKDIVVRSEEEIKEESKKIKAIVEKEKKAKESEKEKANTAIDEMLQNNKK